MVLNQDTLGHVFEYVTNDVDFARVCKYFYSIFLQPTKKFSALKLTPSFAKKLQQANATHVFNQSPGYQKKLRQIYFSNDVAHSIDLFVVNMPVNDSDSTWYKQVYIPEVLQYFANQVEQVHHNMNDGMVIPFKGTVLSKLQRLYIQETTVIDLLHPKRGILQAWVNAAPSLIFIKLVIKEGGSLSTPLFNVSKAYENLLQKLANIELDIENETSEQLLELAPMTVAYKSTCESHMLVIEQSFKLRMLHMKYFVPNAIPSQMNQLTTLRIESVEFSNNENQQGFVASLPISVIELTFSDCIMCTFPNLKHLTQLQKLHLVRNKFLNETTESLKWLNDLPIEDFEYECRQGTVGHVDIVCDKAKKVALSHVEHFMYSVFANQREIVSITNCYKLDMSNISCAMPHLKYLCISNGKAFYKFELVPALQQLIMDRVTPLLLPDSILNCKRLVSLSLSDCKLQIIPPIVLQIPSLTELYVPNNQIMNIDCLVDSTNSIRKLDMTSNPIQSVPSQLNMPHLTQLKMGECFRSDAVPHADDPEMKKIVTPYLERADHYNLYYSIPNKKQHVTYQCYKHHWLRCWHYFFTIKETTVICWCTSNSKPEFNIADMGNSDSNCTNT